MKKVKRNVLNQANRIIAFFLALLGFSGCEEVINNTRAEYGVPSADFVFNGKAQDRINQQGIPNMRVIVTDTSSNSAYVSDTAFTDANGNFELKVNTFPTDQVFKITATDIDGLANGSFAAKDTLVEIRNPTFTGGDGHWYQGKTTKNVNLDMKHE